MGNLATTHEVEHIKRHVLRTLVAAYGDTLSVDALRRYVNTSCEALVRSIDVRELPAATESLARKAVYAERRRPATPQAAG